MKINGKQIANTILQELKAKVKRLREKNIIPHLAIILIGNDPASKTYVKQKILTAEKIGIITSLFQYPSSISTKVLHARLNDLNHLRAVHGIIVQQPFPSSIDQEKIVNAITLQKDVDGFHPQSKFEMPIALAVLKILKEVQGSTPGVDAQKIVIIGKGETGGKPIINSFKKMRINPIVIDSKTENPENLTKNADIIISAVGKSNIVKPNMIKKDVVLISIGLHKGPDGKLHGDYEEEQIKNIASFYTPTPGGVGPVNVAMLLKNLIKSSENFSR